MSLWGRNEHTSNTPKSIKKKRLRWKDHIETQLEGKTLSMDERNELKQLRKEVKNLRMEKEILKKASAFFAKEMK